MRGPKDPELRAMATIVATLEALPFDARRRVLEWTAAKFATAPAPEARPGAAAEGDR